MVEMYVNMAYT